MALLMAVWHKRS